MNPTLKTKRHWWQIFVFILESYLALTGVVLFVLAVGRIDVEGPIAWYMLWGCFGAIVGLFFTGMVLIIFSRQVKPGLIALAFACGAVALLVLLAPLFAAAKRF